MGVVITIRMSLKQETKCCLKASNNLGTEDRGRLGDPLLRPRVESGSLNARPRVLGPAEKEKIKDANMRAEAPCRRGGGGTVSAPGSYGLRRP